ncbi:MAG TPA: hypothetical protein VM487_03245 [Phycisphaerae bacterium]|nr:hypothetical protein [Phycisphaerae bacterium]
MITHPVTSQLCIVGLAGEAGSGKDLAAAYLELYGFTRIAFADAVKTSIDDIARRELLKHDLARNLWQEMGDAGRETCTDLWIALALAKMVMVHRKLGLNRFVISDVRYPNEAAAIWTWGGKIITIDRPGARAGGKINRRHSSETSVAQIRPDCTIVNRASREQLFVDIDLAMNKLDIRLKGRAEC